MAYFGRRMATWLRIGGCRLFYQQWRIAIWHFGHLYAIGECTPGERYLWQVLQHLLRGYNRPPIPTSFNPDGTVKTPGCDGASPTLAFRQNLLFTLNTTGPYMNDVRQRVHPLFDFTVFKQFQLHESLNFEIRGEFFNLFNTP
jgi:hypothetical protein